MKLINTHNMVSWSFHCPDIRDFRRSDNIRVVAETLEEHLALCLQQVGLLPVQIKTKQKCKILTGEVTFLAISLSDRIQASSGPGTLRKLLYIQAKNSFVHSQFLETDSKISLFFLRATS